MSQGPRVISGFSLTSSNPGGILALLEEAGNTANRELESSLGRARNGLLGTSLASCRCGLSCHFIRIELNVVASARRINRRERGR